jgi:NIPSNAP
MKRRTVLKALPFAGLLPAAAAEALLPGASRAAEGGAAVFELREYTTYEGKLGDLLKRFHEHTIGLFERHGMKNVAYWTPTDEPLKGKTLIYILKHPSREAATANWKAFEDDPEWKRVRAKTEESGKIVEKVVVTFMELTDFSARI